MPEPVIHRETASINLFADLPSIGYAATVPPIAHERRIRSCRGQIECLFPLQQMIEQILEEGQYHELAAKLA
ncbi:MAG: hypothetical protein QNJ14_09645 [Woeseiaceae bacterium]|nr:hypothetical protein [Woeseiaceae bacterium]